MKQVNFDSLRQIKAPEELITRTLKAAEDSGTERPAVMPLPSLRRRAAIAAGVILVLGASLMVYFLYGNINGTPTLVAPATAGQSTLDPLPTTDNAAQPTRPGTSDMSTEMSSQTPSVPSTDHQGVVPTEMRPVIPSVPAGSEPPTVPTTPPTLPTAPPVPTVPEPSVAHTDPPEPQLPTAAEPSGYIPTDPPFVTPTESTDDPITETTEPPEPTVNEPVSLRATFTDALLTGSGKVYCAIYENGDHDLIGGDRFSSSHEARIVEHIGDYVVAEYQAPRSLFPAWKMYRIEFYNEDGESIKVSGRYLP